MKKVYVVPGILGVFLIVTFMFGSCAYAQDLGNLTRFIQGIRAHRDMMVKQLGLVPIPFRASSYYDDKVDHYEHTLFLSDYIDFNIEP